MCYNQKCKVVSLNLAHPVDNELLHRDQENGCREVTDI